jgi:hypothetical protein
VTALRRLFDRIRPGGRVAEPDYAGLDPAAIVEARLDYLRAWYEESAVANQLLYRLLKGAQIALTAFVPVFALVGSPWVAATAGALAVLLEGLLQVGRHHQQWLMHRATAEALKRERVRYLARLVPYDGPDRHASLADTIERLVADELTHWVGSRKRLDETDAAPRG